MCLSPTGRSFAPPAFVAWSAFPPDFLSIWLGAYQRCSKSNAPSPFLALVLQLLVEQLIIPAQILPDWSHAFIAHQCL